MGALELRLVIAIGLVLSHLGFYGFGRYQQAQSYKNAAQEARIASDKVGDHETSELSRKNAETAAIPVDSIGSQLDARLCQGLPRPSDAGGPERPGEGGPGDRDNLARLGKDLKTCRSELDRLTAIDNWASEVGLQGD